MASFTEQNLPGVIERTRVPKGMRDVLIFDDAMPNFFVRVFASGKATFGVKYRVGDQQRRLSLGPVVPKALADRRKQAGDVIAKARLGQDVQAEKRVAAALKAVEARRETLGQLVSKFLAARKGDLGPRTYGEWKRYLEGHWKPLHSLALAAIKRSDVVSVLDDIEKRGKVAADRAKTALSAFYSWAIDRGYCDATPVLHIKARNQGASRTRVLTETELVEVWEACEDDDHGRIVKLLILTGQRKREIGDLRWSEIDWSRCQIDLAPERTKNGRGHIVPLSDEVLAVLRSAEVVEGRGLVFGQGEGGFGGWSKAKSKLNARITKARRTNDPRAKAMPAWVLHDLRRSFVTHLNERQIAAPHIIEAIVNHVSGHLAGVAGVYNKAQYLDERRQALRVWGEYMAALVAGSVVPMRRSA